MKNILLTGNPNVGKTSVFNALTGSNEKISNFEGVTVQQKSAQLINSDITLVDLPGVNGFSSKGTLEKIVFDSVMSDENESIINVIDSTNFKRNSYFLIDLLESGKVNGIILNMFDLMVSGIDVKLLSKEFNVPVYTLGKEKGDTVICISENNKSFKLDYGNIIEDAISNLEDLVKVDNARFIAIQFLKGNENIGEDHIDVKNAQIIITKTIELLEKQYNKSSIAGFMFSVRRNYINDLIKNVFSENQSTQELKWLNEKFDKIALHKIFGFFVFAAVMYAVFYLTFNGIIKTFLLSILGFIGLFGVNVPASIYDIIGSSLIEYVINWFATFVIYICELLNAPDVVTSFLIDGALAGVTGVLVFLPQIIIMFTLLTILEGIGYFSRVTVLFENLFNKIGLSAMSLVPYISGLGCNVLGIMSARNIKSEPKRIATILSAPFVSCSARLPVYVVFINIFFPSHQALVLLFLYFLGIFVAIVVAFVIDRFIYNDSEEIALYNIPRYSKISLKYLKRMVFAKIKTFVNNAGKFILLGSIIIWFLSSFSFSSGYTTDISSSFIYTISSFISPIFSPLGFGSPEAVASLVSAFMAKELAISAMLIMYGTSSINELNVILAEQYTTAGALSFMVFTLLYIPCLSTLGVIYSELGKLRFVIISVLMSLFIGYLLAFIVYNLASLF